MGGTIFDHREPHQRPTAVATQAIDSAAEHPVMADAALVGLVQCAEESENRPQELIGELLCLLIRRTVKAAPGKAQAFVSDICPLNQGHRALWMQRTKLGVAIFRLNDHRMHNLADVVLDL